MATCHSQTWCGKSQRLGIYRVCSSPAVEGDRVYVVTNRCEVVCLDIHGLSNGNDGPYKDEAEYIKPKGLQDPLDKNLDADILWIMTCEMNLESSRTMTSSSALIVGDSVYVATSNGVDWSHTNIPSPLSPSWIALDKNTGELIGEDGSGASQNALHAAWSSLAYGVVKNEEILIWGGTDGFLLWIPNADPKG